jgi:hypothetical protein
VEHLTHAWYAEGSRFFPPAPFRPAEATKVTKNFPFYVENKADCRQTSLELLKWFSQFPSREFTLHVIFEREEIAVTMFDGVF